LNIKISTEHWYSDNRSGTKLHGGKKNYPSAPMTTTDFARTGTSLHTSQTTKVTRLKHLMLFSEIIAVYCEHHGNTPTHCVEKKKGRYFTSYSGWYMYFVTAGL
jgi:hypothetical protein